MGKDMADAKKQKTKSFGEGMSAKETSNQLF